MDEEDFIMFKRNEMRTSPFVLNKCVMKKGTRQTQYGNIKKSWEIESEKYRKVTKKESGEVYKHCHL